MSGENVTVNKLRGTLAFIVTLDDQLHLQRSLETIKDTLNNLVNNPAAPQFQGALASALTEFAKAAQGLANSITPSQAVTIDEMGGAEFFDPLIGDKVQASISANAMTPTVARDFVQSLANSRKAFLDMVRATIQGLEKLNFSQVPLPAGSADLAFIIPRALFEGHLGEFAKELNFISRLIQDIAEGVTGQAEPVELESLSSSIPTITVGAGLKAIEALAAIVNKFLEAWQRIHKIRKVRDELTELGMEGVAVEELTEKVNIVVEEIVEESTELVLVGYNGHDPGRKNELKNALGQDVRRLFGQIERGLTVEFHAEPKSDAAEDEKKALNSVVDISRHLKFPSIPNVPLLLDGGEVLEGEIRRTTTKRTSTSKTVSTRKESKRDSPEKA